MSARGVQAFAAALAVLLIFLGAAASRVPASGRLQEMLAQELAYRLQREVAVGPLTGGALQGYSARGLAVADVEGLADGAFLRAERVGVRVSWWRGLVTGHLEATLTQIRLQALELSLRRDARGDWNLPSWRAAPSGGGSRPILTNPRLLLEGVQVRLSDAHLASEDGSPLLVSLQNGSFAADLVDLVRLATGKPSDLRGLELAGRIRARWGPQSVGADLSRDPSGLLLRDLRFVDGAVGDEISARSVRLRLGGKPANGQPLPLALMSGLDLETPVLRLSRAADGSFSLIRQARRYLKPRGKKPVRVGGQVRATGGTLQFTDHSLTRAGQPLVLRADGLKLGVDLVALQKAIGGKSKAPAGEVQADLRASCATWQAAAHLDSDFISRLTLTELVSTDADNLVCSTSRLSLQYRAPLLAGKLSALNRVDLGALQANIVLDRRNHPVFLPASAGRTRGPGSLPLAGGRWVVRDGDVTLTLGSLQAAGSPLHLRLRELTADLRPGVLATGRGASAGTLNTVLSVDWAGRSGVCHLAGPVGDGPNLTGLVVRQGRAPVLQVSSGRVVLDLRRVARSPAEAVRLVSLRNPHASLTRDADGVYSVLRPFLPVRRRTGGILFPPVRIQVAGGSLLLVDRARPAGLNRVRLDRVAADLDLARLSTALRGRSGGFGRASARVSATGNAAVAQGDLAFSAPGRLEVRNLSLTVRGQSRLSLVQGNVGLSLPALGRGDLSRAFTSLRLQSGRATLLRERDGQWELIRLVDGHRPRPTGGRMKPVRFALPVGVPVSLGGVHVQVTDPWALDGPAVVTVSDLKGRATVGRASRSRLAARVQLSSQRLQAAAQIRTDLASVVTLAGASADAVSGKQRRPLLRAAAVSLSGSVQPLVLGNPMAALQSIGARNYTAQVVREADGVWEWARLLRGLGRPAPVHPTPLPPLRAQVRSEGGTVTLVDYSVAAAPTRLELRELRAAADLGALANRASGRASRRDPGWVQAQVALFSPLIKAGARLAWHIAGNLEFSELSADRLRPSPAPLARVASGRIEYALSRLAGARPMEAVGFIRLDTPDLTLNRWANGDWELVNLIVDTFERSGRTAPARDWGILTAEVMVRDGRLSLRDEHTTRGGPLVVQVTGLNGHASGRKWVELDPSAPPADLGVLAGSFTASWPGAQASGVLSTDLVSTAEVRDFSLRASGGGPFVTGAVARAQFSLEDLLAPDVPAVAALREADVSGLQGHVTRLADGTVDLTGLFGAFSSASPGSGAPPTALTRETLRGRVRFTDSALRYTDQALPDQPITIALSDASGSVDLARIAQLSDPEDLSGLGEYAGQVTVSTPRVEFSARLESRDLSCTATLFDLVARNLRTGRRQASVRRADVDLDLAAALRGRERWAASLLRCSLQTPQVELEHKSDGSWDVADLFASRLATESAASVWDQLRAVVDVSEGSVRLTDRAVSQGSAQWSVAGLSGHLDLARLQQARAGRWQPGVGTLRGLVDYSLASESGHASVDLNLDGHVALRDVSVVRSDEVLPVAALRSGSATFDPAQALSRPADLMRAVDDVQLNGLWVRLRKGAAGWEVLRATSAYAPAQPAPGRDQAIVDGMGARVRFSACAVAAEDAVSDPQHPWQALLSDADGDVRLDRLAQLRAGKPGAEAGWLQGHLSAHSAGVSADGQVRADLSGRMEVREAHLTRGGRTLFAADRAQFTFTPEGLLGPQRGLAALHSIALDGAMGDVELDERGQWELASLVPAAGESPTEGHWRWQDFRGVLQVRGGALKLRDRRPNLPSPLLAAVEANDIDGRLDFAAVRAEGGPSPGQMAASVRLASADTTLTGRLSTDLHSTAQVRELSAVTTREGGPRELLAVREAVVSAPLLRWLEGAPAQENLNRVEVWDLRAELRREEDGSWELQRYLAGLPGVPREPQTRRLTGTVVCHNSDITYRDDALDVPGGVRIRGIGLEGVVDLAALGLALDGRHATSLGALSGRLGGHYAEYALSGALSTDGARVLEVRDLLVRRAVGEEPVLSASRITARGDVPALLHDDVGAAVEEVFADGLTAHVIRNAGGQYELARAVPARASSGGHRGGFTGRVVLAHSQLRFTDLFAHPRAPLEVLARRVEGSVDVGALQAMRRDGVTRPCGRLACALEARGEQSSITATVTSDLAHEVRLGSPSLVTSGGLAPETLTARECLVQYDAGPLLTAQDWGPHLRLVRAEGLVGSLTREADGQMRAVRLVAEDLGLRPRSPQSRGPRTPPDLRGRLQVVDATLDYRDEALLTQGPLIAHMTQASADLDFSGGAVATGIPSGPLQAQVEVRTPDERLVARVAGDFSRELEAHGLQVLRVDGTPVLVARRAAVAADLRAVLRAPESALNWVRGVAVEGLDATLHRDAGGKIISPQILALQRVRHRGAQTRSLGSVASALVGNPAYLSLADCRVKLEDDAFLGGGERLEVQCTDLGGRVSLEPDPSGVSGWRTEGFLSGRLQAQTPMGTLTTELRTDVARRVSFRDLKGLDRAGNENARAELLAAEYRLDRGLQGTPWDQCLTRLEVRDLSIHAVTDAGRRVLLAGIPVGHGVAGGGGPLGELQGLSVTAQADARGVLHGTATTAAAGSLQAAQVKGSYDPVDRWLDVEGTAEGADLSCLAGCFLPAETGHASARLLHVRGSVYGHPDQPERFAWAASAQVSDGVLYLRELGGNPIRFFGPVQANAEGLRSDVLRADWGPVSATISGALLDYSAPCLTATVQAQSVAGGDLLAALPPKARSGLRGLQANAPIHVTATVAGPLENACADVSLRSEGELAARAENVGTVHLADLNLAATVVGWHQPSVRATVSATGTRVVSGDIPASPASPSEAHASFLSAGGRGIAVAQIQRALVRNVDVEDLELVATQNGRQWSAPVVQARVAGGQMHGRLTAELEERGPQVRGSLEFEGTQLTQWTGADFWPVGWSLGGAVSAHVAGAFNGPNADCVADIQVQAPRVKDKTFEAARALLQRRGGVTQVRLAELRDGPGHLWVRGTLTDPVTESDDLRADLQLAAAEMDLAKLPLSSSAPELGGYTYLVGRLQGPIRDPDLDLTAQAFSPQVYRGRADVFAVQLSRRGKKLTAPYVLASAGRGVLAATRLRVDDFRLHDPGQKTLYPDGDIQAALIRGFSPVEDVARAVGQQSDTGGWLDLDGAVGGTLRRPTLDTSVRADKLRFGDVVVDEARLPVTLSGDRLLVSDGYVRAHGGELSLAGRVDDLYGRRTYSLAASLPGISIEDIPVTHRLRLDAAGTLAAPQIVVWGAADRKPSGSLVYQLSDLRIGGEQLQPVFGWLQFAGDIVQVAATRVRRLERTAAASGTETGYLSASALYDTAHGLLDADLRVVGPTGEDVSRTPSVRELAALPDAGAALRVAAPVVAAIERALANADRPKSGTASRLLGELGLRGTGKLEGRVRLVGPLEDLNCRAQLGLYNARLDGKPFPRVIRASLGADLRQGRVYDLEAEAVEGRQYLTAHGSLDLALNSPHQDNAGSVNLSVEGAEIDVPLWREWLPRPLPVGGTASFVFTAEGPVRAPTLRGSLDVVSPSYAGARFDVLKLPLVEVGNGAVRVTRARLIRSETRGGVVVPREVAMSGSLPWSWKAPWVPPQGPVDFHAEFGDIDVGFFLPILDEIAGVGRRRPDRVFSWSRLETRGTVRASLDVTGTWGSPSLQGAVSLAGGAIRAPGWSRPWEDLTLDVSLDRQGEENRALVHQASGRWGSLRVSAHDTWGVLGFLTPEGLARNQYHVDLSVDNDRPLDIGGLQVGTVHGGISLQTLPTPPETPNGPRTHELTFNDVVAQMGTGSIRLSGYSRITSFLARDFHRNEYDLQLTSSNADVRYMRSLRGRLSGAIRMHRTTAPGAGPWAPQRVRLDGSLNLRNADLVLAAPRGGEPVVLRGLPLWVPTPTFDVRLSAGEGVLLRGMGVTVPVAPGEMAHLTGTLQSPNLSGSLSAREGAVRVPTGALQIKQAKITYALAPVGPPAEGERTDLALTGKVDIRGERLFTNVELPGWGVTPLQVHMAVEGEIPNDIHVRLWSEPPLQEEQLVAMLGAESLGGLTGGGGAEETTVSQQALSMLAAGFRATIFEPIETELMRLLQLSEFNVRFGFNQETEVRLGKYLVKDLLVSYQHSVGGGGDDRYQLSLSYRLKNRVFVAYTTNERNENRVKLTYDVPFRSF